MPSQLRDLEQLLSETTLRSPRPIAPLKLPDMVAREIARQMDRRMKSAAVLVPIIQRDEPTVLLTRRSDALKSHSGQVSFPGGRAEPGDKDAADTALRETEEEVAVGREHTEIIGYLDDYPTITGYLVTPVVAKISADACYEADHSEVAEIFEVPLSVLLDRRNYERHIYRRLGIPAPYYRLLYDNQNIWGVTAGILMNLVEKYETLS